MSDPSSNHLCPFRTPEFPQRTLLASLFYVSIEKTQPRSLKILALMNLLRPFDAMNRTKTLKLSTNDSNHTRRDKSNGTVTQDKGQKLSRKGVKGLYSTKVPLIGDITGRIQSRPPCYIILVHLHFSKQS